MSEPGHVGGPPATRMRAGRRTVLVVALWAVAATVAVLVAWRAVAAVDADAARTGVLSTADVTAQLADARAAATATAGAPTPSASSDPSTSPIETPASTPDRTVAAPVEPTVRSWTVTGGTVAVTCSGTAVGLLYATPLDGWGVEVGSPGPEHVEVTFAGGDAESKVKVRCEAGVPVQSVEERSEGEGSEED